LKQQREQKKEEEMEALKRTMRSGMVISANLRILFVNLRVHIFSLNLFMRLILCIISGTSNERAGPA
jgi:hypothetical protein